MSNVQAFIKFYQRLHIPVMVARTPEKIFKAEKLILPGVRHFDYAMQLFNRSGLRDVIEKQVLENNVPVLVICVGMQMLAQRSDECTEAGLGWINADVRNQKKLMLDDPSLPLLHMRWNDISPNLQSNLFKDFDKDDSHFIFLYSFYFDCDDSVKSSMAASDYGQSFCCAANMWDCRCLCRKSIRI